VVSPHVRRGVCSNPFEHCSIAKTILLRFGKEGSVEQLGPRVSEAEDLSVALRDDRLLVPFTEVPGPQAEAAVYDDDLRAVPLPGDGSRIKRTLALAEHALTDLQFDLLHGDRTSAALGPPLPEANPRFPG
jgi:hypothetical protein